MSKIEEVRSAMVSAMKAGDKETKEDVYKRQAGEILKENELQTLRYIPYCSVGTEKGVLPVIRAEKMCIHTGQECWVEKPLIGICEEDSFTNGEYQMILNPAILGGCLLYTSVL